eukprot:CFRG2825T1
MSSQLVLRALDMYERTKPENHKSTKTVSGKKVNNKGTSITITKSYTKHGIQTARRRKEEEKKRTARSTEIKKVYEAVTAPENHRAKNLSLLTGTTTAHSKSEASRKKILKNLSKEKGTKNSTRKLDEYDSDSD